MTASRETPAPTPLARGPPRAAARARAKGLRSIGASRLGRLAAPAAKAGGMPMAQWRPRPPQHHPPAAAQVPARFPRCRRRESSGGAAPGG
eukprot:8547222-Pyramimonas_sp.AAC.1